VFTQRQVYAQHAVLFSHALRLGILMNISRMLMTTARINNSTDRSAELGSFRTAAAEHCIM
jgi:hypothetical protein